MENIIFIDECKKVLNHTDLGWTQDEWDNFMIDIWTIYKEDFKEDREKLIQSGEVVTFTLTPECYPKRN